MESQKPADNQAHLRNTAINGDNSRRYGATTRSHVLPNQTKRVPTRDKAISGNTTINGENTIRPGVMAAIQDQINQTNNSPIIPEVSMCDSRLMLQSGSLVKANANPTTHASAAKGKQILFNELTDLNHPHSQSIIISDNKRRRAEGNLESSDSINPQMATPMMIMGPLDSIGPKNGSMAGPVPQARQEL